MVLQRVYACVSMKRSLCRNSKLYPIQLENVELELSPISTRRQIFDDSLCQKIWITSYERSSWEFIMFYIEMASTLRFVTMLVAHRLSP
mmetsp:Transcript_7584/g.14021  ORF Transcript_7584/g.14021 Transcript_7584/m.14021 type:complete len:89 (+) Transcript_7584:597-863(+)